MLEELFELLKTLPNEEAQAVLQRIKSNGDISTILSHIKAGDLLLQMAVVPETRMRYDFPYRSEMPEDCFPNNPYLDSLIYEGASLDSTKRFLGRLGSAYTSTSADPRSDGYSSPYLKPFHAAEVVDPQLSRVKVSSWTTVCHDDVLMQKLLAEFLRCEYHFTAAFQKDLFLEDMALQREDFCSSLLVNIMLGYACVCYPRFTDRAEYWNPHTLLYSFIAEAKRLWELEPNVPRITTIQAGILFNVFYNLCGLDELGQATIDEHSRRICQGRAFTAWALYNWESLVGFSFHFSPLLKKPPEWQLPDPSDFARWYGEVWTLVRLYYLRHGFEAMDLFIVIPLMLAASDCLDEIDERMPMPKLEALRSTLFLAAKGLYNQRRNHYLAQALFRVIRGRMRPAEVALLRGSMDLRKDEEDERRDMAQPVRSHWPVNVVKKKEDSESQILTNLVESYAHLNIEGDSEPGPIVVEKGGEKKN
ncbi:MAG: hypothetical protein Q9191_006949 [Dirinaria sp. TL-2023a]